MLRLATRGSQLALVQAGRVASLLRAAHPGLEVELVTVSTTGDMRSDVPVWEMGGQGVFVREVQAAVISGRADAAVHSAKDLQPVTNEALLLAAVPERADPRDALVGCRFDELAKGAVVATGSQRRRAQLAHLRPDLRFESLRGNIGTRLAKVPAGGAIVVAMAALERLAMLRGPGAATGGGAPEWAEAGPWAAGKAQPVLEVLGPERMLPQVAQGALAVECRADDEATAALLAAIDDKPARRQVEAERAFLASIGGGCNLPVAGHACYAGEATLNLEALLASPDGAAVVRVHVAGPRDDGARLGQEVANLVLASGGQALLAGWAERG